MCTGAVVIREEKWIGAAQRDYACRMIGGYVLFSNPALHCWTLFNGADAGTKPVALIMPFDISFYLSELMGELCGDLEERLEVQILCIV